MPSDKERGAVYYAGGVAAKEWLATATYEQQVTLAGYPFRYGLTLNNLIAEEAMRVPASSDRDFSWGFYKQVKSKVYSAMHNQKRD